MDHHQPDVSKQKIVKGLQRDRTGLTEVANHGTPEEQPVGRPHRGAESASHSGLKRCWSPRPSNHVFAFFPRPSLSPPARSNQSPFFLFGLSSLHSKRCVARPDQTEQSKQKRHKKQQSALTGQQSARKQGLAQRRALSSARLPGHSQRSVRTFLGQHRASDRASCASFPLIALACRKVSRPKTSHEYCRLRYRTYWQLLQ